MSISKTTNTYAGEFAGKYISAALLTADTIDGGGIEVIPNVRHKQVVRTLNTDSIVYDASCDFQTGQGTITLDERIIQPKELQVNLDLCATSLTDTWEAAQMGYSAHKDLPTEFSDFLIGHVAAKVAQKTEQTIWEGDDTANNGEFDGLTTLLAADTTLPSGQDIVGQTLTASNILAEMRSVVQNIPSAVYGQEDLHLYISSKAFKLYLEALSGYGASGLGANGVNNMGPMFYTPNETAISIDGVKIFVARGLADNAMVAAQKSNLYFGTGLLNDAQSVSVLNMREIDGSQNFRIVMRYTAGVQYGTTADITAYGLGL